jgi:hypothetical protein
MMMLALMMASASVAAWIIAAAAPREGRSYIRLASVLFSAFAIAAAVSEPLGNAVGLIASAVGPALLALAMVGAWRSTPSPVLASLALALAVACGIAAAATNRTVPALAPPIAAVTAMVAVAIGGSGAGTVRAAQAVAAALSFLAGACIHAAGGAIAQTGLMLFSSAGLLGVSLALARDSDAPVEEKRTRDLRRRAIR